MTTPTLVQQDITPAVPEPYVESDPAPERVSAVIQPDPEPEPVKTVPAPAPVEPVEEPVAEPDRVEDVLPGVPAPLVLEGTDWIYLGEEDAKDISFSDRRLLTDRTLFSFLFPEEGTYVLLFLRQDNSTGESEEMRLQVNAGPLADAAADTTDKAAEDNDIADFPLPAIEPESESIGNSPGGVLEAEEKLAEIEENPDKAGETIELLEFLMDVASDDEDLAGYYYRLARTLEMNSQYQDLRRSYETYQYIEDRFFLTDYYEKARERIRYLDRHFFKLR